MASGSEDFAILFSGGGSSSSNHSHYYDSLKGLYEVLVGRHGLSPENIIVLYADAGATGFDQNMGAGVNVDGLNPAFSGYRERFWKKFESAPGVDPSILEEFRQLYAGRGIDGVLALSSREAYRLDELVRTINSYGLASINFKYGQGQNGDYFFTFDFLVDSDLSFALDRGSTVLPATADKLHEVLTDSSAAGGFLDRVDANDHVFVWTFDHGGFDGRMIGEFGDRSQGNRSTLTAWDGGKIASQDLAQWLVPLQQRSGASTLAFAQCFSGGMLEALQAQLSQYPQAYGMAAANGHEQSINYSFAEGVRVSLSNGNPSARDLFREAKEADDKAFRGFYEPNGGDQLTGVEHPWAYPADGGNFSVFAGQTDFVHPLESHGLSVEDDQSWAASGSGKVVQLSLQEDGSLDLRAALVSIGEIAADSSITSIRLPDRGEVIFDSDGRLLYVPLAHVNGADALAVQVEAPSGVQRLEINLNIAALNDRPQAVDDRVVVSRSSLGTRFSVDALTGVLEDFDFDGDELAVVDYSNPAHGQREFLGGSSFLYTPDEGFEGEDRFLYQISDGTARSVAEVTLDVGGRALNRRDEDGAYTLSSPLMNGGFTPITSFDGGLLSDRTSSRWNLVNAVHLEDRYALLVEGQGRREGLFKVWDAVLSGGLIKRRGWWSGRRLERRGYESIFQRDFDGDGEIAVSGLSGNDPGDAVPAWLAKLDQVLGTSNLVDLV